MRTMYDALTARNILKANPPPALVAGYIDKIRLEPWSAADWALFPGVPKVEIVKKASTNAGHVLDVEPGDATPEEAPGWAAMRRRSGFAYPVVYCNRSTWPKVKAAFAAQNVPPPLYWIATGNGLREIPGGAIAAQYLLDVAPGIDVSAVADYWPGVDPAPHQDPNLSLEDDMTFGATAPAGTNEHVDLAVVGCSKLRIHCSFQQKVKVRAILFYGDTPRDGGTKPAGVGGGYDGEFRTPQAVWTWDENRPGPTTIPDGATTCTVLYDAAHSFYVSAAPK